MKEWRKGCSKDGKSKQSIGSYMIFQSLDFTERITEVQSLQFQKDSSNSMENGLEGVET